MDLLKALFRLVFALTLAGGFATLLVLGAKALVKDRLGPRWNYYVWALPLALYLVPVSLPLPRWGGGGSVPAGGAPSVGGVSIPVQTLPVDGGAAAGAGAQAADPALWQSLCSFLERALPVLAWAWLLGVFFCAAVRLVDSHSLAVSLEKCSRPCEPEGRAWKKFQEALAREGVAPGKVGLMICPGVESPLLLGLRRPRVVLPREDYSAAELTMIFRHELTHYRCHDLWYKAAALGVACLHWFNPLVWRLVRDLDRCCELLCDHRTTSGMGPSGRRQYGRMLLDVAQDGGRGPREERISAASAVSLAMDKKELKRRLTLLRAGGGTGPLDRAAAWALALVVAVTGAVCSSAVNPGPVFQGLFRGAGVPVVETRADKEVPELWGEDPAEPEAIPQPNPADVKPQPPLQMQVVLSDEAEDAAAALAAEEAARKEQEAALAAAQAQAQAKAREPAPEAGPLPGEEPEGAGGEEPPAPAGEEAGTDSPQPGEGEGEDEEPGDAGDPIAEAVAGLSWDGEFSWPVDGGYISCGLYEYYNHNGVDIAADSGTEIYAAADGVVTYATAVSVWPYGKSILVAHGDGAVTRYAHCSKVLVEPGDIVQQGDLIALVGRTGNATGSHCHFEVLLNGAVKNPVSYIGAACPFSEE